MKLSALVFVLILLSSAMTYCFGFVAGFDQSERITIQRFYVLCNRGVLIRTESGDYHCGKAKNL